MATTDFPQFILDAYNRPDPCPFLFRLGKCRVKKGVSRDGQTPAYWNGAIVEIISFYSTGLYQEHWYKVRHLELDHICQFREDELDMRYSKSVVNWSKDGF